MSLTIFPNGMANFSMPGAAGLPLTTGNVFFVSSGAGADGNDGLTTESPLATLDAAVGKCTASKGDIIVLMPGHAETLVAATSCVLDIAGVSVIGLGWGALRPKFTYTTAATATMSVTAPNVSLSNLQFYSNFTNGIAVGVTVGALADGFRMNNCRFEEAAATKEFLIAVSVAAACHDVIIDGFEFCGVAGGTDSQCIKFVGASNFSKVKNFSIMGDFSGAPIDALTAASTFMEIGPGVIVNPDTGAGLTISVKSDSTGMVHDVRALGAKDTAVPAGAAMGWSEVYVTNAAGTQGILKPAADS